MPNWCSNSGHIKGDPAIIKQIWDIVSENENGLTALHPCPSDLTDTMSGFMSEKSDGHDEWKAKQEANMEKYGYTDWYGWCVDNWGTKWAPDFHLELSEDGDYIHFSGDSAWSPPVELLLHISKLYPVHCYIQYSEEGNAFVGASIAEGGKLFVSDGEPSFVYDDNREWHEQVEEAQDKTEQDLYKHELAVLELWAQGISEPEKTVLLGRDILPQIGKS